MKFGLIGYPLGHSWSKQIHSHFISDPYEMFEMKEDALDAFFEKKDFDGINVTIPYKTSVMKYLDAIDPMAEKIGAVNCIVNRNGKLTGYNTDYLGFQSMLVAHGVNVKDANIAVLGSGGASKAITAALQQLGGNVSIVSRRKRYGVISYDELYQNEEKFSVIVNTTPVGMYPENDETPIDITKFTKVKTVVDIIANPLRSRLLFEAKIQGIQTIGGFEMLVRQAFYADEYFKDQKLDENKIQKCMNAMYQERRNYVLIGMPTAGKTTVSQIFGEYMQRTPVEMDDEIVKILGTSIKECFATKGEAYFRNIETQVARDHREANGEIISCGGGVIKIKETMRNLWQNGIVIWIKRDLSYLYPTDTRPLSSSEDAIKKMYEERLPLYEKYSDVQIENNGTKEETIQKILNETEKRITR